MPYATIAGAIPPPGGSEVICVNPDPATATAACPGGIYQENIFATTAQVRIRAAVPNQICVTSLAAGQPTIRLDLASASGIEGFAQWENNHGMPAIFVTNTQLVVRGVGSVAAPLNTAILGRVGANLQVFDSGIGANSNIGIHLTDNASAVVQDSTISQTNMALIMEHASFADLQRNEITANNGIAKLRDTSVSKWRHNLITANMGPFGQVKQASTILHNNLWYNNNVGVFQPLIDLTDQTTCEVTNNTFDANTSQAIITTTVNAQLTARNSIFTSDVTGITCGSSVPPVLEYDNFWNLSVANLLGCPVDPSHQYLDPQYASGTCGTKPHSHFLGPTSLVNGGSALARMFFPPFLPLTYTTQTTGVRDTGVVDLGYHCGY